MAKLSAPTPEFIEIDGKKQMLMSENQLGEIYQFMDRVAGEINNLVSLDEDVSESPLSYLEYLITKLKISQNFFPAGAYLSLHVSPDQVDSFLQKIHKETHWRLANGALTPKESWLVKGGILNLPDARGVVMRGFSDVSTHDPEGWERELGSFQDYAIKNHFHESNLNFSTPMVGSNFPDFHVMREEKGTNVQTTETLGANVSEYESRMKNISVLFLILT